MPPKLGTYNRGSLSGRVPVLCIPRVIYRGFGIGFAWCIATACMASDMTIGTLGIGHRMMHPLSAQDTWINLNDVTIPGSPSVNKVVRFESLNHGQLVRGESLAQVPGNTIPYRITVAPIGQSVSTDRLDDVSLIGPQRVAIFSRESNGSDTIFRIQIRLVDPSRAFSGIYTDSITLSISDM
ncbi:hypothetical protein EB093_05185 [bacterium]|nr:hypothetical protein [bacterium]